MRVTFRGILVAGVLFALFAGLIMGDAAEAVNYAGPAVNPDQFAEGSIWLGALAEGTAAFVLRWAIMATAVDPRGSRDWAPYVIGRAREAKELLAVLPDGPVRTALESFADIVATRSA